MKRVRDVSDYTADELLAECCRRFAVVSAGTAAAIEAHRMAVSQKQPDMVLWLALTTIILATARSIDDQQIKLDYLAALPEAAWPPTPAPFCAGREQQLDTIRRSIGWQMAG